MPGFQYVVNLKVMIPEQIREIYVPLNTSEISLHLLSVLQKHNIINVIQLVDKQRINESFK